MKYAIFLCITVGLMFACCKPDEPQPQPEPIPQSCVTLISPANGAVNQANLPSLTWKSACNTDTFQVQISLDPNFDINSIGAVQYDSLVVGKQYQFKMPTPNTGFPFSRTVYWRVIPYHDGKNTLASTVFSYKTLDKRDEVVGSYACQKYSTEQVRVAGGFTYEGSRVGASNITITKHPTIDGGVLIKETNASVQNDYDGDWSSSYAFTSTACYGPSAYFLTGSSQDSFDVYLCTRCNFPLGKSGFRYKGKMR